MKWVYRALPSTFLGHMTHKNGKRVPLYMAMPVVRGKSYAGKIGPRERSRAARRLAQAGA